jgi:hypothetical protein
MFCGKTFTARDFADTDDGITRTVARSRNNVITRVIYRLSDKTRRVLCLSTNTIKSLLTSLCQREEYPHL